MKLAGNTKTWLPGMSTYTLSSFQIRSETVWKFWECRAGIELTTLQTDSKREEKSRVRHTTRERRLNEDNSPKHRNRLPATARTRSWPNSATRSLNIHYFRCWIFVASARPPLLPILLFYDSMSTVQACDGKTRTGMQMGFDGRCSGNRRGEWYHERRHWNTGRDQMCVNATRTKNPNTLQKPYTLNYEWLNDGGQIFKRSHARIGCPPTQTSGVSRRGFRGPFEAVVAGHEHEMRDKNSRNVSKIPVLRSK